MRVRDVLPLLKSFNVIAIRVEGEGIKVDDDYKENIIAEMELDGNEREILDRFGDAEVTDIWARDADDVVVFCVDQEDEK